MVAHGVHRRAFLYAAFIVRPLLRRKLKVSKYNYYYLEMTMHSTGLNPEQCIYGGLCIVETIIYIGLHNIHVCYRLYGPNTHNREVMICSFNTDPNNTHLKYNDKPITYAQVLDVCHNIDASELAPIIYEQLSGTHFQFDDLYPELPL